MKELFEVVQEICIQAFRTVIRESRVSGSRIIDDIIVPFGHGEKEHNTAALFSDSKLQIVIDGDARLHDTVRIVQLIIVHSDEVAAILIIICQLLLYADLVMYLIINRKSITRKNLFVIICLIFFPQLSQIIQLAF